MHRFDVDNSGSIEVSELYELLKAVNKTSPTIDEVEEARKLLDANNDGKISWAEFLNWYETSVFFKETKQRRDTIIQEEEEHESGVSIRPPQNFWSRVNYLITIPIILPLYLTVPDVRREKWQNWYPYAFWASIAWLGFYSYLMVWWASTFGDTLGIPPAVMGLTLLAAGKCLHMFGGENIFFSSF